MSRKVLVAVAGLVALAVLGGFALAGRGSSAPAKDRPFRADPTKQYGDDADLMRRLERKKLVQGGKR